MNLPARKIRTHTQSGSHWLSPVRWQLRLEPGGAEGVAHFGPRPAYAVGWRGPEFALRALNFAVALVGLILTAPLFLAIAVLVKLSSPGPVIYAQDRVGLDRRRWSRRRPSSSVERSAGRRRDDTGGQLFRIFKFRTMVAGSDRQGQVWASHCDPRITAVGHVLRKYRLDELPQLLNVLRGDMNMVGPRPEQPNIFRELRARVSGYRHRQQVLPGITGWAQINQSYDQTLADVRRKVAFDLEYIEKRSLWKDLKIMARTVPVMIGKKGSL
jgi:lipopolysaccharide/colanic/teichoic acid biosynthesis glycosyltransferase